MAELDPEKVGRLGVDPTTGSPLSQEVRNALLKKSTIDSATFRNEMFAAENKRKEVDIQNANVIQSQERALGGFNSNIQALRTDIGKLGTGLASIALLLQQDGATEQNRIRTEQEQQKKLTERQVRIGKENELEQKIQSALSEPVQKLTPQVNEVFGNIGSALAILFGGWLTKQTVDAIKASEEGNTKLFDDIKWNIIKNLGIVGGGLFAIKVGFGLVTGTIVRIAFGLTRLLIAKPLAIAAALLPKIPKPGGAPPTTRRPGGKGPGLIGGLINGLTGLMNWMNGEKTDAVLAALTFVPGGAIFRGIRAAAGITYTLDQIAELFGSNLTGVDPKLLAKKKKEFEDAKTKEKKPSASSKSTPSKTPPAAQPQTSMMGEQKPSAAASPPSAAASPPSADATAAAPAPAAPTGSVLSQTTAAASEPPAFNPSSAAPTESVLSQTTAAASEPPAFNPSSPAPTPVAVPAQMNSAQPSQAQLSSPPTAQPQRVGELPEAKPSLTMIKTSNNQNQQSSVPLTNGPLTDVPLINSANPDNFYVLYSQLSYNVVI